MVPEMLFDQYEPRRMDTSLCASISRTGVFPGNKFRPSQEESIIKSTPSTFSAHQFPE